MAKRRIFLLAIPPVITLFAALLYTSTIGNVYQSDMLMAIDPQRVPDSFVRSTVTLDTDRRMDSITVKVLSRTNLARMIQSLDLYPEERRTMLLEDVVAIMHSNVRIDLEYPRPRWGVVPQPSAFHVRFTYPDPVMAAKVTSELGALFVEQNITDRASLAGATNRFLETQLADSRQKLEDQEQRLEAFRQRYGRELPTQLESNLQAFSNAQLQAQSLVESIASDRDRKLLLERLYRDALAEPVVVMNPTQQQQSNPAGTIVSATTQQQLTAARTTLSNLTLRYRPDHPDVVRTQRLIAELEPKAAEEARQASTDTRSAPQLEAGVPDAGRRERLREMRAEVESLDRQTTFKEAEERRVRESITEYQRRIEAVPGLESEWIKLTRDYDTLQSAYKDLLSKSGSAQLAANLEDQDIGERFRIVDEARVPVHPLPSMRIRYNATGLAIGLVFGFAIAALLEIRDASYRSDADVLDLLALPVLATVPRVHTTRERQLTRRRRLLLSVAGSACLAAMGYLTWTLKLWAGLI